MNCGAQTCLFTYLHAAAGRVYSIEFLQLNHFSSELEGVVLYKMTDKVHGIHQFGNKWRVGYYQKPISHQLWNFPHLR